MSFQPRPLKWPPIFPLDKGLVAWWPFDDRSGSVLRDRSGKGNHGTLYGPTWVAGRRGSALSFDGVDDYVEIPNSDSLGVTATATFEAWAKIASLPNTYPRILSKETGTAASSFAISVWSNTRQAWLTIAGAMKGRSETVLADGTWYHIVFVIGDGLYAKCYVNGKLDYTVGIESGTIPVTTYNLLIGNNPTTERQFHGIIDEVRVYNRALTAAEIKRLYETDIMMTRW